MNVAALYFIIINY